MSRQLSPTELLAQTKCAIVAFYRGLKQDFLETAESKTIGHSKLSDFNQAKERNASLAGGE